MGKEMWANVAVCAVLAGLLVCGVTTIGSALTPKGLWVHDAQPCGKKSELIQKVVVQSSIKKAPNNLFYAGFLVNNGSAEAVKNILVQCDFTDRTGRHLDRELWLLPEVTKPGLARGYYKEDKRFIHTNARVVECHIRDLEVVEEPLYALHRATTSHEGAPAAPHGSDQGHSGH